jgi:Tfp pilus assembly protein PilO
MRLEKQQLGIFAAIIGMTAVFAVLQYMPLRSRAHAMEQVKAAQLSTGTKTETQIKNLPAMRTQLAQMQVTIGNYEEKIPDERKLGTFLQEIADVMNKHNLSDQVVQPDSEIKIDNIACIPVRMQCSGTLRQIFEFFESLRKIERLMRIEQVQFKNDHNLTGMVTMVARADIYYRTSAAQTRGQ